MNKSGGLGFESLDQHWGKQQNTRIGKNVAIIHFKLKRNDEELTPLEIVNIIHGKLSFSFLFNHFKGYNYDKFNTTNQ